MTTTGAALPPGALTLERTHFPDYIVAEAYSMLQSGYSNRRIADSLAEAHPGERTPSKDTIRAWDQALAESSHEEVSSREQRIIAMSDDIIAAGLTELQANPGLILKHLMTINAIRGTMQDKQFKRSETSQPSHLTIVNQFYNDFRKASTPPDQEAPSLPPPNMPTIEPAYSLQD